MVPLPFHQTFLVELALARAMLERIVLVLLLELTTDFVVLVTFVDVLLKVEAFAVLLEVEESAFAVEDVALLLEETDLVVDAEFFAISQVRKKNWRL